VLLAERVNLEVHCDTKADLRSVLAVGTKVRPPAVKGSIEGSLHHLRETWGSIAVWLVYTPAVSTNGSVSSLVSLMQR